MNCSDCRCHYFCCTLKVKLTWFELLKIWLHGHKNFWEKDNFNNSYIKINNFCHFFDRETKTCQIYKIRPKPCRQFPFETKDCLEIYQPWQEHQDKLTKLLNK